MSKRRDSRDLYEPIDGQEALDGFEAGADLRRAHGDADPLRGQRPATVARPDAGRDPVIVEQPDMADDPPDPD